MTEQEKILLLNEAKAHGMNDIQGLCDTVSELELKYPMMFQSGDDFINKLSNKQKNDLIKVFG